MVIRLPCCFQCRHHVGRRGREPRTSTSHGCPTLHRSENVWRRLHRGQRDWHLNGCFFCCGRCLKLSGACRLRCLPGPGPRLSRRRRMHNPRSEFGVGRRSPVPGLNAILLSRVAAALQFRLSMVLGVTATAAATNCTNERVDGSSHSAPNPLSYPRRRRDPIATHRWLRFPFPIFLAWLTHRKGVDMPLSLLSS